jgi:hypothetical protein
MGLIDLIRRLFANKNVSSVVNHDTSMYCPLHYGRIEFKDLTYSCHDGHFKKASHDEVLEDMKLKSVWDTMSLKDKLTKISSCRGGNKMEMYCSFCEKQGDNPKRGIDISSYLYLGNGKNISVLGTASSGKSVLIGCLHDVIKNYSAKLNWSFMVMPPRASREFFNIYVQPMFPVDMNEKPKLVDKTQLSPYANIFYFEIRNDKRFLFYDISGENQFDIDTFSNYQYIRESQIVILLIDPESLKLQDKFLIPSSGKTIAISQDIIDIFGNIINLYGQGSLKKIIFALTKSDYLFRPGYNNPFANENKKLADISKEVKEMYFQDPHIDGINEKWMENYSKKCKVFLKELNPDLKQTINNAETKAEKVEAFVVSSLGTTLINIKEEEQISPRTNQKTIKRIEMLDGKPQPRQIENIIFSAMI